MSSILTVRKEAERSRNRGNANTLKHRKVLLNIRKHFFTVRVTEHWHRLPREVVKSSSLEILKKHLDTVLAISSRWSCLSRRVGPDDLQRPLLVSIILLVRYYILTIITIYQGALDF